jgi:hypothetical protein
MPDTKEKAKETDKVMVINSSDLRGLARHGTAEEMRALRKNPLDKAKRPGGYFVKIDGTAHDANGKPVPIRDEDLEMVKQLRALRGLPELGAEPEEGGGTELGAADYEAMKLADLQALAAERGLTVTGKGGGKAAKADYVAALAAAPAPAAG